MIPGIEKPGTPIDRRSETSIAIDRSSEAPVDRRSEAPATIDPSSEAPIVLTKPEGAMATGRNGEVEGENIGA